jgi:hypothetical protein
VTGHSMRDAELASAPAAGAGGPAPGKG